ncbi:hypothetical protein BGW39_002337 [Mortierella sp. 14UC]|nr:hypothetical protein BGW39_002337 [Mortierella sp. 14UC]
MKNLACKTWDLSCAQNKTTAEISSAQAKAMGTIMKKPENKWIRPAAVFRPTVDKFLIPADFADLLKLGKYNKNANTLWGYTKDEGNTFVPFIYPNPVPLGGLDKEFAKLPYNRTRVLIKSPYYKKDNPTDSARQAFGQGNTDFYLSHADFQSNVYTYRMDHGRSPASALGMSPSPLFVGNVCHADDLISSFESGGVTAGSEQTGDDARFARQVIDRFTTFAKTGNPNPNKKNKNLGAASQSPDLTRSNPIYAFSVANSTVTKNGDAGRCSWLNENTQYDYQVNGPGGRFVPIFPPVAKPPTSSLTKTKAIIQTPSSLPGRATTTNTITTVLTINTPSSMSDRQTTTNALITLAPITTAIISPPPASSTSESASVSASPTVITVVPSTTTVATTVATTVPTTTTSAAPGTTMTAGTTTTPAPINPTTTTTMAQIGTTTSLSMASIIGNMTTIVVSDSASATASTSFFG